MKFTYEKNWPFVAFKKNVVSLCRHTHLDDMHCTKIYKYFYIILNMSKFM